MTLSNLIEQLNLFVSERQWEKFHSPKNLATALSIESSELEEIFLWKTTDESESDKLSLEEIHHIRQEIGDVMIYLLMICIRLGIDPIQAAHDKMKINEQKYPVDKAKNNRKKYTEL